MPTKDDNIQPEYDFSSMGTPIRGKHFAKYQRYVRTVRFNDELARRCPDEQTIVNALTVYVSEHPET